MADRENTAAERFACGDRERALFEAGIKMGTLYHQFVGTPVSLKSVEGLEKAMSDAIEVQPYVEKARVTIVRDSIPEGGDEYSYSSLTGEMIDAIITIRIGDAAVTAEIRYDEELRYPLMFVSDLQRSRVIDIGHSIHPAISLDALK